MLSFNSVKKLISFAFNEDSIYLAMLILIITFATIFLVKLNFSILLAFSFLANLIIVLVLFVHTINSIYRLSITNCVIIIFNLAFFIIAPIAQLTNIEYNELINTLPLIENQLIEANFIIFIFTFCYFIFRIFLTFYFENDIRFFLVPDYDERKVFLLIFSIFIMFFPINCIELINFFKNGIGTYNSNFYPSPVILILIKFVYLLPVFLTALIISRYPYKSYYLILSASLLICFFFKNPFIENRSGFGTAFLLLFWISIKNFLKTNLRIFLLLFLVIFILFPIGEIVSLYRNIHITSYDKFFNVFNTVHYDSWANGVGIVDFIHNQGLQYGNQLLGTLLFWVPRDLWANKPIATGQLLGEYLINNYHHWMSNISSPLIFEGYVDFGYIGVIFFALLLAVVSEYVDKFYSSKNINLQILSTYIGISYFFVLRGPLLSSFVYTFAGVIAICFGMWLVNKLAKKG